MPPSSTYKSSAPSFPLLLLLSTFAFHCTLATEVCMPSSLLYEITKPLNLTHLHLSNFTYPNVPNPVRGLRSVLPFSPGDPIMTIPHANIFSLLSFSSHPIFSQIALPPLDDPDFVALVIAVLHEVASPTPWGTLLRSVDLTSFPSMLTESEITSKYSTSKYPLNLLPNILASRAVVLDDASLFSQYISPLLPSPPPTYHAILTAITLVTSRNFGLTIPLIPYSPNVQRRVMVPIAELMNVNHTAAVGDAATCELTLDGFVCRATVEVEAGGELFFYYDEMERGEYIVNYGYDPVGE